MLSMINSVKKASKEEASPLVQVPVAPRVDSLAEPEVSAALALEARHSRSLLLALAAVAASRLRIQIAYLSKFPHTISKRPQDTNFLQTFLQINGRDERVRRNRQHVWRNGR